MFLTQPPYNTLSVILAAIFVVFVVVIVGMLQINADSQYSRHFQLIVELRQVVVVLFCALEAYCLVLLGDYSFHNSAGELFWWYEHSSFARIVASSLTNVHLGDAAAEHTLGVCKTVGASFDVNEAGGKADFCASG